MSASRPTCIIWDWNGTLLDDTAAALAAFNEQLTRRSLTPITLDFYRRNFGFPVKPFYALCGINLAQEDWDLLAREYHESYARQTKALNVEAVAALARIRAAGIQQCILSALRQDLLDAALEAYGIRDYFDLVYGVDNLDGASKLARGRELLGALNLRSHPRTALLIGDSLHDAEVASDLGLRCVLCAQGGHAADRLKAVAPTGETLLAAVELALDCKNDII